MEKKQLYFFEAETEEEPDNDLDDLISDPGLPDVPMANLEEANKALEGYSKIISNLTRQNMYLTRQLEIWAKKGNK